MRSTIRTVVVLLVSFSLQGCWFVFLPPGATSAISDAMTGSEGANCVSSSAKVGDYINLPNGEKGRIKSLSGTSSRCTDTTKPIRALILSTGDPFFQSDKFVDTNPVSAPSSDSIGATTATVQLPIGWEKKDLTSANRVGGRFLLAINKTIDSGLALSSLSLAGVTDTEKFVQSRVALQIGRLDNASATPLIKTKINGYDAYQTELSGNAKTGTKVPLVFMQTYFIGKNDLVLLSAWTSAGNFLGVLRSFQEIAKTISLIDP